MGVTMNHRLINLSEAFSEEGLSKLKVNQTLTFLLDGVSTSYKIKKIKDGQIWAKELTLYRPEDVVFGEEDNKKIYQTWADKVTK